LAENFDVIIVGGGLGGLSLAYGLADRGRSVAVLEARAGVKPIKRGMSISPSGLEALDKLHLLDDVEKIGVKVRLVKFLKSNGKPLVTYDYSFLNHPQNYILTILPHELDSLLRKNALAKGVKLYDGALFEGLLSENGQRRGVQANIGGATCDLRAEVIVGADGAMSKVRASVGIRVEVQKYQHDYVVTVAGEVENSAEEARHYLAKGKMLGMFPLIEGTYIFYYLPTGTFEGLKARGLDSFKADLVALAPELADPLATNQSWEDFPHMTPQRVRANSWVSDRVALIGDAVHSLEPTLGQGGSLTLQDVVALLGVLDQCFGETDFSENALKRYEESRKPQTEFIQIMAERAATYMNTSSSVIAWLRDRSLRNSQKNCTTMLLAMEMASGLTHRLGIIEKLKLAGIV